MRSGVCRVCGCTQNAACVLDQAGRIVDVADGQTLPDGATVCSWIEPDLCSGCVDAPAPPPLLFGADGKPLRGTP